MDIVYVVRLSHLVQYSTILVQYIAYTLESSQSKWPRVPNLIGRKKNKDSVCVFGTDLGTS